MYTILAHLGALSAASIRKLNSAAVLVRRPALLLCRALLIYAVLFAGTDVVTGVWLLTEELYVLDGITLQVLSKCM